MKQVNKVVFVINTTKPGADQLAKDLSAIAAEKNVETRKVADFPIPKGAFEGSDLCCVIGGDGTILGVVQQAAVAGVPVMGVNFGRLGFMANFSTEQIRDEFADVLAGAYPTTRRTLIECVCEQAGCHYALNEVTIRARTSRLIRLRVQSNGNVVNDYNADGIIVSTPTGSTAYNLSAGGPIVHPDAPAIILTPINPHTLSNRSIVLPESQVLTVGLAEDENGPLQISGDGHELFSDGFRLPLRIRIAPDKSIQLIHHPDYSHFEMLRSKLRWTGETRPHPYRC